MLGVLRANPGAVRRPEGGEIESSDPNLPAVLGTNIAANGRGVVGNSTSTIGTSPQPMVATLYPIGP